MTTQKWIEEEPGPHDGLRQAAHLLRGGVRRKYVSLAISLALVGSLASWLLLARHNYAPRLVMRVVEMGQDPSISPRPSRDLKDYIREAVWTSEPLLELIRRHGLYASLAIRNPRAALESMREDSEIDVYQNYFVETRSEADPPRSARVVVRYRSPNRDLALEVTRELAALIVEHEHASRIEQASYSAAGADRELQWMRRALQDRRSELSAKEAAMTGSPQVDPELKVELVSLLGSVSALGRQIAEAERREGALALGAAVERQRVGLRFDVLDDGALASSADRSVGRIVGVALVALFLGTPLVALGVGAADCKRSLT
jgi:hypothetical protein